MKNLMKKSKNVGNTTTVNKHYVSKSLNIKIIKDKGSRFLDVTLKSLA